MSPGGNVKVIYITNFYREYIMKKASCWPRSAKDGVLALRITFRWRKTRALCLLRPNIEGLPWGLSGKEPACQCRRHGFDPWAVKISWSRKRQPTPAFFPGKFHSQRSLVDYSPWGRKELDTAEHTHTHTHTHTHNVENSQDCIS